jgi:membrane protein implicated in regulation of membrane protease activity
MSALLLLAIGIGLLIAEIFTLSFALIWVGIGFIAVALVHWVYPIHDVYVQIALASGIGLILMLLLRKKLQLFFTGKEVKDEFLQADGGIGVVYHGSIKFKGTMWQYEFANQAFELNDGDQVHVLHFSGNKAVIAPKQKSDRHPN